jgi:uncharacterized protein (UPF0335 family)
MTDNVEQPKKLTNKEVVERLVNIYREVSLLQEDSKSILSEAKEQGLDHSTLNKVAKAIANDKVNDVEEACQKFLDLAEEVV